METVSIYDIAEWLIKLVRDHDGDAARAIWSRLGLLLSEEAMLTIRREVEKDRYKGLMAEFILNPLMPHRKRKGNHNKSMRVDGCAYEIVTVVRCANYAISGEHTCSAHGDKLLVRRAAPEAQAHSRDGRLAKTVVAIGK